MEIKQLLVYVPKDLKRELKELAATRDCTLQALLISLLTDKLAEIKQQSSR